MVRQLCRKPAIECLYQARILGGVGDLRAIGQCCVVELDVCSARRQLAHAWHIRAMDSSWVGEVASTETHYLMLEVCLDERNLLCIRRVFSDHHFNTARVGCLEIVGRLIEIEGHNLPAQ